MRSASQIQTPLVPVLPGRGGAQHKHLQELIRRWGEANGWRVTVEQQVLDGLGSVDVALEREGASVACEIGCSTSSKHELENKQKCLAAGFTHVCAVVMKQELGIRMETLTKQLGEDANRVFVGTPEQVLSFLQQVHQRSPSVGVIGGYRVRVRHSAILDAGSRRAAVARAIVGGLKRIGRQ